MVKEAIQVTFMRPGIHKELKTPGITPITTNGKLSGVLISNKELDEPTSSRLLAQMQFNPRATINEILDHT